jgi:hypothetical protein
MKFKQQALAIALLLAASVASPAVTVKCKRNCTLKIGKFTYIGENQQNQASFFVVDMTKPNFFPDLTFSNIAVVVKDAVINSGPETVQVLPNGTPFGLLYVFGPPYNGAATCKDQSCVSVALQAVVGDGSPFTVISTVTGRRLTYYGVSNTFIVPRFGNKSIQGDAAKGFQDSAPITFQLKSITN